MPGFQRASKWASVASLLVLAAIAAAGVRDRHRVRAGSDFIVTATAFNSEPRQTDADSVVTAFGSILGPGVKALAVSRDLLAAGLEAGSRVIVEGLPGEWVVADKMARRWRRRIDIYMGNDTASARAWGRRRVRIRLVGRGDVPAVRAPPPARAPGSGVRTGTGQASEEAGREEAAGSGPPSEDPGTRGDTALDAEAGVR